MQQLPHKAPINIIIAAMACVRPNATRVNMGTKYPAVLEIKKHAPPMLGRVGAGGGATYVTPDLRHEGGGGGDTINSGNI